MNKVLYLIAILLSLLLSFIATQRAEVINPDAICYLMSAETISTAGLKEAMQLCGQAKWPFYALLINGIVQVTHLSYVTAAFILDALLSALSVVMFISIVNAMGGTKRILWLAAGVILLSHQFNSIREYIVRDHGFWAFYLLSLWLLIYYYRTPSWKIACAWGGSLLLATLFRIEGAIFLILIPLVSGLMVRYTWGKRLQLFFMLNIPLLLIGGVIAAWLLFHPQQSLDTLTRVAEVINQFQHGITKLIQAYQRSQVAIREHVLTHDSASEAGLVLWLTFASWYLLSVVRNLSWIYSALVIYAWFRRAIVLSAGTAMVLWGYIIVNFLITASFLLEHLFLSKRYLIALSLVLMLWVPFALDKLIAQAKQVRGRILLGIVVLLIMLSAIGGIVDFGYSKAYKRDAGTWLSQHVAATDRLYVNDYQVMYYANHFGNALFPTFQEYIHLNTITQGKWNHYDYIALRIDKQNAQTIAAIVKEMQEAGIYPLQTFKNKRGDSIVIYKIHH